MVFTINCGPRLPPGKRSEARRQLARKMREQHIQYEFQKNGLRGPLGDYLVFSHVREEAN